MPAVLDNAKQTAAPRNACTFQRALAVTFEADQAKSNTFSIVGYSGGIIPEHYWWGNLAFDLAGLKFAKKRTPILDSHATDRRVGFATKQDVAETVTVEGTFLDNDVAQSLRADMQQGFPMEASLYVPPKVVEYVKEGASVQVNGHTLKGPGAVFRQATIKEVSLCVFGADERSSAQAFAADANEQVSFSIKEQDMDKKTPDPAQVPMTTARLEAEFADVHTEVLKTGHEAGAATERQRFADLQTACGDDSDLMVQCFAEGKTVSDAQQMRIDRLETDNTALKAAAKPGQKATTQTSGDPAITEFKEQVPGKSDEPGDKGPASFMEAVTKFAADQKVSQAEAVNKCVDLYPELHAKMQQGGA